MKPTAISIFFKLLMILSLFGLGGCATQPRPNNIDNICSIFRQYPQWYADTKHTQKKWGVPIPVQMAIMHQESSFNAQARPPRKWLLGFIPWKRPSSAYGYPQALNNTWKDYQRQTGNHWGKRHAFEDATDFIGWYSQLADRKLRIQPTNAHDLYLAYHEGVGGYSRRSYLKKPWLLKVANKVAHRSQVYAKQLKTCEAQFNRHHWWLF